MADTDKILNRLTISRHDIERCGEFLAAISAEEYGSIRYEALLLSAIIFYARPFSLNEIETNAKATKRVDKAVLKNLSTEEVRLHEQILELRNKAIAHAEWNYHPTGVSKNKVIKSMPFPIWKYFQQSSDIDKFSALAAKVLDNAHHLSANMLHGLP